MSKVYITDTILRDAHQSLAATRMRIEDMLPIANKLDKVGYWSLEAWGGATFDSCLRFLYEDPWERLRKLRAALPNTKIQMLLRGQNLLGYKHYADDVVDLFVKKSKENGVDVFRIFDALNDVRNLRQAIESTKKYGGIVEAALCYTTSPVHTNEYFVDLAVQLEKMGADTICIKDMANLLLPYTAYDLVRAMKKAVHVPIHLHTHNTSGTGEMVYLKAIEAGVDIIDTAVSTMANGTSQPATEPMIATLRGTEYDTGLDLESIAEIADASAVDTGKYETIDAQGMYVAPGLLDMHIHGYAGEDTSDANEDGLLKMCRALAENGVTSWCPTTMTVAKEDILAAFDTVRKVHARTDCYGAKVLGVNCEGPFINPSKKGAQAEEHILRPDAKFILDNADIVRVFTIAPEMDGGLACIRAV